MCHSHYYRQRRYGDPLGGRPLAIRGNDNARWLSKFRTDGIVPNGIPHLGQCWPWLGELTEGYGRFRVSVGDRPRLHLAHVYAWEQHHGCTVPLGLQVDHMCHSFDFSCEGGFCIHRSCVNPRHLQAITQTENNRRGRAPRNKKLRAAERTHCIHGHPLSGKNLYLTKEGWHLCRTCRRAAGQRRTEGNRIRRLTSQSP